MNLLKARFFFMFAAVVLAFPIAGQAPPPGPSSFGAPHQDAPAELAQLAFVIGEWKLDAWFAQNGDVKRKTTATLKASYVLDGFGIQMENRYPRSGQADFVGTNLFVFNTRLNKWIGSGINTLGNRKDFEGTIGDGKLLMVQTGMQFQGRPGINRVTFFPISDKEFKLRYDYSPDSGTTWHEGTFGYTATRVR